MVSMQAGRRGMGDEAHVNVQALRLDDVVVDQVNVEGFLLGREVLDELGQFGATHAVGTVDRQAARGSLALEGRLEGLAELFVVALLGGCAIGVLGALRVQAAHHIVQLRSGEEAVVLDLGAGGLEAIL